MSRESLGLSDNVLEYLRKHSVDEHPVQQMLREVTAEHEKSEMQISSEQGRLMQFLIGLTGAKRCIEIGVFTGYSALSVALALPDDGIIRAFDVSEEYTQIGRKYWDKAGVTPKIDLHIMPAARGLKNLLGRGEAGTYDFAFIDADKTGYDDYYELCLQLLKTNGLMAIDNVLWSGKVADQSEDDDDTQAIRALNAKIASDDRVDSVIVPISDGVTLVRKIS